MYQRKVVFLKLTLLRGRVPQIAAFSGSIRKASTNSGLLRAASKVAAATDGVASFTIVSIADLPLFNEGAWRVR